MIIENEREEKMKKFEIEVSAFVTVNESESFLIKAETLEEAKEKAIKEFSEYLDDKYAYVNFDDVEFGYISETRF